MLRFFRSSHHIILLQWMKHIVFPEWGHDFRPEHRRLKEMIVRRQSWCAHHRSGSYGCPQSADATCSYRTVAQSQAGSLAYPLSNRPSTCITRIGQDVLESYEQHRPLCQLHRISGISYTLNRRPRKNWLKCWKRRIDVRGRIMQVLMPNSAPNGGIQFLNEDVPGVIVATDCLWYGDPINPTRQVCLIPLQCPKSIESYYPGNWPRRHDDGMEGSVCAILMRAWPGWRHPSCAINHWADGKWAHSINQWLGFVCGGSVCLKNMLFILEGMTTTRTAVIVIIAWTPKKDRGKEARSTVLQAIKTGWTFTIDYLYSSWPAKANTWFRCSA